jgi:hypothetical protein
MNPILLLKNISTKEEAFVYREVFNSAVKVLGGQTIKDDVAVYEASNLLWIHVKEMSEILNTAIRERLELSFKGQSS